MGENKAETLARATAELDEMYSGIPDESIDLTFQHLIANLKQNPNPNPNPNSPDHHQNKSNKSPNFDHREDRNSDASPLTKMPSFEFSKSLQASSHQSYHLHRLDRINEAGPFGHRRDRHDSAMASAYSVNQERSAAVRRRPGSPHSKICTVCSAYTYILRHRCLVCGRVYCRHCVKIGMGEMTEGRKCIECLGRRLSQRYIQKAGEVGCFCARYPIEVRRAELKWAEKGPRRSGERGYGRSGVRSRSSSPLGPRNQNGPHSSSTPNSFVMSSSYSPYTPSPHHYPF